MWLERGELDNLIDLNSEAMAPDGEPERQDRYERPRDYSREYATQPGHRPRKRKGRPVGEAFDFD